MTNQINTNSKLYFPFFYKYYPILSVLSSSDIGDLFCLMVETAADLPISREVDPKLKGISDLILDDVNRLFMKNQPPRESRGEAPQYSRCNEPEREDRGESYATAAFEAALRRSYSDMK